MNNIDFILSKKDWLKIWDFHFSLWFLERWMNVHIKFGDRLGNENRNTLHVFESNSESAYFLEKEIESLRVIRRKKLLSKKYISNHFKEAKASINKIEKFINFNIDFKHKKGASNNLVELFFQYSDLLEELLSYYRASRQEVFEIIEEKINDKKITKRDKIYYAKLIKDYGELRLEIKKKWLYAEKKAKNLKQQIAALIGLNVDGLEYFFNKEIKSFFAGKKVDFKQLIKERKKCIFGIVRGRKVLLKYDEKIARHLEREMLGSKNLITGKVASIGRVAGRIRLVPQTNYKEMIKRAKKFKQGEILVTGMTQPDIMFACRKAAAIITDEGGITSHAAIISRELKIPCIIGTKIATKVFKDGDLVEVDAERGVVKILKRKNED